MCGAVRYFVLTAWAAFFNFVTPNYVLDHVFQKLTDVRSYKERVAFIY